MRQCHFFFSSSSEMHGLYYMYFEEKSIQIKRDGKERLYRKLKTKLCIQESILGWHVTSIYKESPKFVIRGGKFISVACLLNSIINRISF